MLQCDGGYGSTCEKRIEIAEHLRYVPMGYFNANSLGYITSVTTNTMEQLSDIATRVVMLVTTGLINTVIVVLALFFFDWRIGLVALVGVIIYLAFNTIMKHLGKKFAPIKEKADLGILSNILDYVLGISEVKSYNLYGKYSKRMDDANEYGRKVYSKAELSMIPVATIQTYITRLIGVAMTIVAIILCIQGVNDLATTMTVIIGSYIIYASLDSMGTFSTLSKIIERCVQRANEILGIKTMKITGENHETKTTDIEFKNVSFSYDKKKIIDDVSLKIKGNSKVAFVGPSGSGKTTICHLIPRFYFLEAGHIYIDKIDISDYTLRSLREKIGIVQQDVFLFGGTIKDNILYGRANATDEEVLEAAKKANILDFINSLPKGLDTEVGERGVRLSGGQKQRLSIARLFLKNPPILILDEATSALDNTTEMLIQKSLQELAKGRTCLIVAHRLSTIKNADEIAVISKGKIMEMGTHEDLLKLKGIYADLYRLQFKNSDETIANIDID